MRRITNPDCDVYQLRLWYGTFPLHREPSMPYVTVYASSSFSADQKKQLLQRSSDAVVDSIGAPLANVRVMLHELSPGQYLNAGQFDTLGLMFVVELIQ